MRPMSSGGQNYQHECMHDDLRRSRRLTFELTGHRRWDARPGLAKMYRVPPDRAWWPAVGAPVERGVRPRWRCRGHYHPTEQTLAPCSWHSLLW